MKKIFALILSLVMMLSLVACGGGNDNPVASETTNPTNNTSDAPQSATDSVTNEPTLETSSKETSSKTPPNEDKIAQDIASNNLNVYTIDNLSETLSVKSVNINRRRTNEDSDEVYVCATYENDYYNVTANLALFYSYYDVGGWYLEYGSVESYSTSAHTSIATEQQVIANFSSDFDSFKILSHNSGVNNNGVFVDYYSFEGEIAHPYVSDYFTGSFSLEFVNNEWTEHRSISYARSDWSKFKGTWTYQHTSGDYITVTIDDIDPLIDQSPNSVGIYSGKITYRYDTSAWHGYNPLVVYDSNSPDHNVPLQENISTVEVSFYSEKITLCGVDVYCPKTTELHSKHLGYGKTMGSHNIQIDRDKGLYILGFQFNYPQYLKEEDMVDFQHSYNATKTIHLTKAN